MDIVTPIFEACLTCWDRTAKYRKYIRGLPSYLANLEKNRNELSDLLADVNRRVELEEQKPHREVKKQIYGWKKRVEVMINNAAAILEKKDEVMQKNCLGGCCPTNCRTRYKLAKEAEEMTTNLIDECDKGRQFEDVAQDVVGSSSVVGTQEPTVGMDSVFDTVWKWVEDESVRSIGLFGVGGVGKTTLLKKICSYFLKINPNYFPVLYVEVSGKGTLEIQEQLRQQLNFNKDDWDKIDQEKRRNKMQRFLVKWNFVLFLDNLSQWIDLQEIGIPFQNNSKVIFTTRSEYVCIQMQTKMSMQSCRREKIECLPPKAALQLFRQNVGEETWDADYQIPKYAEVLVRECGFLPLALVVIGNAMVNKREPRQWEQAIKDLRTRPTTVEGMIDKVLLALKYSYDALPDETHKRCFLYCALFPGGSEMEKEDLVNLWIGEGFYTEYDKIHEARNYFEDDVICKLKSACLLEENLVLVNFASVRNPIYKYKMHDLVREMALWVAREDGNANNKILVQETQVEVELEDFKRWKDAEMVSLMVEQRFKLPSNLSKCSNLCTLILRYTGVVCFPSGFFASMPSLKVLDLSFNRWLRELGHDIGHLTKLQYLNLLHTDIEKLPDEFRNLVKLKFLFLGCEMEDSQLEVLSTTIPSLRVFSNLKGGSYNNSCGLKLLELLQDMEFEKSEVYLVLYSKAQVEQLWRYPRLQGFLRDLMLKCRDDLSWIRLSKSLLKRMAHLEMLGIKHCRNLEEIGIDEQDGTETIQLLGSSFSRLAPPDRFKSLCQVEVSGCGKLLHLTLLIFCAPNLASLRVVRCSRMTQLLKLSDIPENQVETIFQRLTLLLLDHLPELKSICERPLPFSSLKWVVVRSCESLQKLPFDANNSYSKLQKIEGEQEWWDSLQWDHPATTQKLLAPKFKNHRPQQLII